MGASVFRGRKVLCSLNLCCLLRSGVIDTELTCVFHGARIGIPSWGIWAGSSEYVMSRCCVGLFCTKPLDVDFYSYA